MLPYDVSKDNRILLVIDEAQNYFNKKNPILAWFITQHRHLFIELVLITQKHTLLHSDYHLFNLAYNAFPPIKQFSKNSIAYNEYAGLPMNNDNFVRKFSLNKVDKVFDMYISGDKVESPNILNRFIWMFFFAICIVLAGIYYFKNMYGHQEEVITSPKKETITTTTSSSKPNRNYIEHSDEKLYRLVVFDNYFHIDGVGADRYPLKLLFYIKKHYFIKVIDESRCDDYHREIYVICDVTMESLLKTKKEKSILGGGVDAVTSFN
jgi:zona occludens toxin